MPYTPQQELSRFKGRYVLMLVLMTLVILILVGRLYSLQVSHGSEYKALSSANFIDDRRDVALRGMIFDRNGRLLADNRPSFNLYFTPAFCKQEAFEATLRKLTELLGLSDTEIDKTETYYRTQQRLDRFLPLLVRRDISWPELAAIEQFGGILEGVEVRPETRRAYPEGVLAAHLLGYVGEINSEELARLKPAGYRQGDAIGKSGIEKAWEKELRGTNGLVRVVKDNRGQVAPEKLARKVLKGKKGVDPAVPGYNLILSLDARLQALAEKRFPGLAGAVVALDPNSGFILAMVSRPVFDPNRVAGRVSARWWKELVHDPDRPLTNRAIQQHYPPGSTFKIITGLAGLESGTLTETAKHTCGGGMRFGGHLFRCWRPGGHGTLSIHRAIVQSCDVFFYRTGHNAGLDEVAEMGWSFGLGSKTGFGEGEEVPGIMPDRDWYRKNTKTGFLPGFTLSDSIGQGDVNVTPLQLALAYAAIANGGKVYRPQVVMRMETSQGQVVKTFAPELSREVKASQEHLKLVADALDGVVNEPGGTAYFRRPKGVEFKAAGKTGTAQVVKQGTDRGKDLPYDFRDHAWFTAYAPVSEPRIVVAVVNEHGGHGSSGAAPLAMEMIAYYMEQLGGGGLKAEAIGP